MLTAEFGAVAERSTACCIDHSDSLLIRVVLPKGLILSETVERVLADTSRQSHNDGANLRRIGVTCRHIA